MPKIVHVVYSGTGGIANVAFSLIAADENPNNEHLVAFYGSVSVLQTYLEKCENLGVRTTQILRRKRFDLSANIQLYRWLCAEKPDAILVNLPRTLLPAVLYSWRKRTFRIIGVEHHPNSLKRKIDWVDSFLLMRFCHSIVYLTDAYRTQIAEKIPLFQSKKTTVIANGVDTNLYHPRQDVLTDNAHHLRIGMAARITEDRDHETLIAAFAELQRDNTGVRMTLTLAGDGDYVATLQSLAKQLKVSDSVSFEGQLNEAELIEWFQSLSIYTHASLGEVMSTSVMQALSCGLPVVASDITGMDELVQPDNGYLVATRDVNALQNTLSVLVRSHAERESKGQAARDFAVKSLNMSRSWLAYAKLL